MNKIIEFIKGSIEEFKKVQWPSRKQTIRLTVYVIGVSFVIALYVSGLDLVFKEVLELILGK